MKTKLILTITCFTLFSICKSQIVGPPSEANPTPLPAENKSPGEIFTMVEEMPEFPGGTMEMMKYIQKNIVYPKSAKEKKIAGKCFLKFIVNKDGSISDALVVKPVENCPECDAEALRVVKSMPVWTPAKQGGKPVSCYFNLPVNFTLR